MRFGLPLIALMLAIGLGLAGPGTARTAPIHSPSLPLTQLFTLGEGCSLQARTGNTATFWAATLRGWAEGPTSAGWRHFVAWTKSGGRPPACPKH
jgi:hypothetical protein